MIDSTLPRDIVFLSGKRTAFGAFGGALKKFSATDLGVIASKAALEQAEVAPGEVDHVIFGNVVQTSADAIYLARHIGLKVGLPIEVPAYVVNRLCGSGFQSLVCAAQEIFSGGAKVVLAGGTESMSQAPHVVRGARWGIPLGQSQLEDSLWESLNDSYCKTPMALTAENLAEEYELSQEEVDTYSVRSQTTWAAAQESGGFKDEIIPVEIKKRKETVAFEVDEHPRPQTTLEGLKKLPKIFKKEGVIHAGAASGICDGGAAMVVADGEWAQKNGKKPIARILAWGVAGVEPRIMGIGPAPAIRQVLEKTKTGLESWDLIEVNEAFAPQYLAVEKELGLSRDKTNVDGGAIALGHPLAASGTRITTHLIYALKKRGMKYGIGSACIGGGQGMAIAIEVL